MREGNDKNKAKIGEWKGELFFLLIAGLFFWRSLGVFSQFFIFHIFVEELVELFDLDIGDDLAEFVDSDIKAFQRFVYSRLAFFWFPFRHGQEALLVK